MFFVQQFILMVKCSALHCTIEFCYAFMVVLFDADLDLKGKRTLLIHSCHDFPLLGVILFDDIFNQTKLETFWKEFMY